jgi:hypothetical protein
LVTPISKTMLQRRTAMRIAYLTTDEVNKNLALRLAAQWDMSLHPLEPRDPPPDGDFDAVLYDWDHWPANQRPSALDGAQERAARPVALHSYSLERDQARALRRSGVLVFDRLELKTLFDLHRAVAQARALQHQAETLDLRRPADTPLPGHAIAKIQASPRPPEAKRGGPSWCRPGYAVKFDPSLPPLEIEGEVGAEVPGTTGPEFPAHGHNLVHRNRCLRCQQQAEGRVYRFAVGQGQGLECSILHEETAYICNRCAAARLRRSAWLLLLTWVPVGLLASGGLLALAARVWLYANPWRRGYLPAVGTLFILSMGLLVVMGLLVRLACRHWRWTAQQGSEHARFADPAVTRMAIELRKKDILSRLPLPESSVRFLIPHNRADITNAR